MNLIPLIVLGACLFQLPLKPGEHPLESLALFVVICLSLVVLAFY